MWSKCFAAIPGAYPVHFSTSLMCSAYRYWTEKSTASAGAEYLSKAELVGRAGSLVFELALIVVLFLDTNLLMI